MPSTTDPSPPASARGGGQRGGPVGAALLAVGASGVYVLTLLPGLGLAGDVTKLQFVGRVLGTPHAPGYPLYVMVSGLWTRLVPLGSVAWRVNLFSALCAVVALLLVLATLRRLGCRPAVGVPVAAAFGLLPAFWSHAVVAEVYTLHVALVAAVLWALLTWQDRRQRRWLLAAAALGCLGLAHHLTIVTMVPAVLAFVLTVDRAALAPRRWPVLLPLPLLGLLPYGYVFWRTARSTTSYLEMQTPDVATWWWYVTGAQFRDRMFAFGPEALLTERLPLLARMAADQLVPASSGAGWRLAACGLALVAIGLGWRATRDRARHLLLLGTAAGAAVYAVGYAIPDLEAYLLPVYLVAALYAGSGLVWALGRLGRRLRIPLGLAVAVLPMALFLIHRPQVDRSGHVVEARWLTALLAGIDADRGSRDVPVVVVAADYLTYEVLQHARQLGPSDGGSPRRDLLVLTPLLPDDVGPAARAFIARHDPPPLIRRQILGASTPASLRAYLAGDGELVSFEERLTVPPGRVVYVLGDAHATPGRPTVWTSIR